ncbi:MAG: S-Ena type endospore appendage [Actinomycetota bacterium]
MPSKKPDVQPLTEILTGLREIKAAVRGLGLDTILAVPVNVPAQKGIDVPCGTLAAVESTLKPAGRASVGVSNRGDCPITVELTEGGNRRGSVAVPAGESGTIATSPVDKVKIDCDKAAGKDPRCKFSYTIVWT